MSAGKTHLYKAYTDGEAYISKCLPSAFKSNQESLNAKLEEINSAFQTFLDFEIFKATATN